MTLLQLMVFICAFGISAATSLVLLFPYEPRSPADVVRREARMEQQLLDLRIRVLALERTVESANEEREI